MFEHIQGFLAEQKPGSNITISYAQMSELGSLVCSAIRLVGNSSALLSKQHRTTVLNKINAKGTLISLAPEEFPNSSKNLFGKGFESRIKTRSETAKTLLQASSVGQCPTSVFCGPTTPFRSRGGHWSGANQKFPFQTYRLQQPPTHFAARSESAEEGPGVTSNPPNVSQPVETLALSTAGMDLNLTLMQMNHLLAAGRLRHSVINWEKITTDSWVLETVWGLRLNFVGPSVQTVFPQKGPLSEENCSLVILEIQQIFQKGASLPSVETPGFVSSVYLVPRKGGGQRPVVNLKPLNQYLPYHHFKMEGIHKVRDLLRKGDFMVKIDLEDADFTVPVSQEHHKFMRFRWEGTSTSLLASPLVCPLSSGIYKNHETSCRSFTTTGHQIDHLFG